MKILSPLEMVTGARSEEKPWNSKFQKSTVEMRDLKFISESYTLEYICRPMECMCMKFAMTVTLVPGASTCAVQLVAQ